MTCCAPACANPIVWCGLCLTHRDALPPQTRLDCRSAREAVVALCGHAIAQMPAATIARARQSGKPDVYLAWRAALETAQAWDVGRKEGETPK